MPMPLLPSQVADSLVRPGKSVMKPGVPWVRRKKSMCSSTVSFGLMVTPAAVSAFSRSSMEMSDFSGLCDRSRQTASVKKFSSGT